MGVSQNLAKLGGGEACWMLGMGGMREINYVTRKGGFQ